MSNEVFHQVHVLCRCIINGGREGTQRRVMRDTNDMRPYALILHRSAADCCSVQKGCRLMATMATPRRGDRDGAVGSMKAFLFLGSCVLS